MAHILIGPLYENDFIKRFFFSDMADQNLYFIIDSVDNYLPASQSVTELWNIRNFNPYLILNIRKFIRFGKTFIKFLLCMSFSMSGRIQAFLSND